MNDVEKEIERRCKILETLNNRMGVKVWFMNDPVMPYTFLSEHDVELGIHTIGNSSNSCIYVEACSHQALFDLDDKILNKVIYADKEFEDCFPKETPSTDAVHTELIAKYIDVAGYPRAMEHLVALNIRGRVGDLGYLLYMYDRGIMPTLFNTSLDWFNKVNCDVDQLREVTNKIEEEMCTKLMERNKSNEQNSNNSKRIKKSLRRKPSNENTGAI